MTTAVLDASVVLKWFRRDGEEHVAEAAELRRRFEAGELQVIAPSLLWLEVVNVGARSWRLDATGLNALALSLDALGIETHEPSIEMVARWTGLGLTAYDAAYVATAIAVDAPLVTADPQILTVAPQIAVSLSGCG